MKQDYKEILQLNRRMFKTIHKLVPNLLWHLLFCDLFNVATVFVGTWYAAKILDMLAEGVPLNAYYSPVLWMAGLMLGFNILCNVFAKYVRLGMHSIYQVSKIHRSQLHLFVDYCVLEDPEYKNRLRDFNTLSETTGDVVATQIYAYDRILRAVINLIFAVILAWSTFTSGNRWANAGVLLAVIAAALLGGHVSRMKTTDVREENMARAKNFRLFQYYTDKVYNYIFGLDMRLYRAQTFAVEEQTREMQDDNFEMLWGIKEANFSTVGAAIQTFTVGGVYLFVALRALMGMSGAGDVVRTVSAVTLLFTNLLQLTEQTAILLADVQAQKTYFAFEDQLDPMYKGSITVEKRLDREYDFEFDNVSFKYPGSDNWVLRNVNLKLNISKKLALVGMNGSGKSTLIKLLCHLYDPTEGSVKLNGVDIRNYDQDEYRLLLSVVFQDFKLFALPLDQNVAAAEELDEERVRQMLEMVGFGDRLNTLPLGLKTPLYKELSPDGVDISGGEAQKIAMARAIYKDAPLIILDEPTAALDPVAEYEIYTKFNEMVGDRTAIYISHRLASCRFCDEIAVFHEGRLVQRGTHEELLADRKGKYAEMWEAQAQYYRKAE